MSERRSKLEVWKDIISIASAVAIPLILAIYGSGVQKQLSTDGLKKDYVRIAVSVLKENPKAQDPDLRKWAIDILDTNAPIKFSASTKKSLQLAPLARAMGIEELFACLNSVPKGQEADCYRGSGWNPADPTNPRSFYKATPKTQ